MSFDLPHFDFWGVCEMPSFTDEEETLMRDAWTYSLYEHYVEGCTASFWKQWVGADGQSGWWQVIQEIIAAPWIMPTVGIVMTVSNVLLVSF